ncbi:hypothetical protein BD410DRAFT_803779 [Rickenella mellea]|uniref:HNH nuclease domain-containing protein n=1 Tax=Rickenella mellea TaxID=50990 RepID=A0A4Y7Q3C5_9AGAM|nr:hypothetical protein BD410DRAFT_803779 [Rickenella mellea]
MAGLFPAFNMQISLGTPHPPAEELRELQRWYDGKCVLTQSEESVEWCHIIPRRMPLGQLAINQLASLKLVPRGAGRLSRLNLIPLKTKYHDEFNSYSWTIYPTISVLERYIADAELDLERREEAMKAGQPDPGRAPFQPPEQGLQDFTIYVVRRVGKDNVLRLLSKHSRDQRAARGRKIPFTALDGGSAKLPEHSSSYSIHPRHGDNIMTQTVPTNVKAVVAPHMETKQTIVSDISLTGNGKAEETKDVPSFALFGNRQTSMIHPQMDTCQCTACSEEPNSGECIAPASNDWARMCFGTDLDGNIASGKRVSQLRREKDSFTG